MTKNMGTKDRLIRTVVALAIIVLYVAGTISGVTAIVLGLVAAAFLVTSSVGYCPGYVPFGISTRKDRSESVRV